MNLFVAIAYFDCIAVFGAPYHWTSGKSGAHMGFVDLYLRSMYDPCLHQKFSDTALQTQQYDRNTRDGITFDFYTGLPHLL